MTLPEFSMRQLLEAGVHFGQALLAMGVGITWVAQWCRLLQASSTFGPLVLMALEMVKDCVAFLVLLSGIFLAFGVAITEGSSSALEFAAWRSA